jgi:hypothetical protein
LNWKEFKAEAERRGVNDDSEVTLSDPNYGGVIQTVEEYHLSYSIEEHVSRPGHPGLITDCLLISIPFVEAVD